MNEDPIENILNTEVNENSIIKCSSSKCEKTFTWKFRKEYCSEKCRKYEEKKRYNTTYINEYKKINEARLIAIKEIVKRDLEKTFDFLDANTLETISVKNFNSVLTLEDKINITSFLKKIRGVYFLLNKNTIVYIGSTENIYARIYAHVIRKKIVFDNVYFKPYEGKSLLLVEKEYIEYYKPEYNKHHNVDEVDSLEDL